MMTSLAAEPAVLFRSPAMQDTGGCDITKPSQDDFRTEGRFERMHREWLDAARYALTLSRDGDWNDKIIVAEWLTYSEANRLRQELAAILLAKKGGVRRWADAGYGISLHTPAITKGNTASVGDLLLHERVIPHGDFSLSDSYVIRQFHVAAEVTAVASNGRIVAYRDHEGMHIQAPKKPYVVSSTVIDVQKVLSHIVEAVKYRGHWAAEFNTPKSIESILVRYQRIKEPVYPVQAGHYP